VLRDFGDSKRAADAMRDELERLQDAHIELKGRLAKLEARLPETRQHETRAKRERTPSSQVKRKAKRKRG
jgi:hypothetical protein